MNASCDDVLCGKLRILQPIDGPRVNMDTILLYSWVKFRSGHTRFLEAGCASGAIALMLAAKFTNIHVTGIDIQEELITLAKINAKNNNLDDRVDFIAGDLRDKTLLTQGYYDSLVINPPYESLYRSRESNNLSRSTARLDLSCTPDDAANLAKRVLKSRGRLFAIFTSQRLDVFMNAMSHNKLTPKRLRLVYPDINNNSGVFLIECVKDGGEGLIILPPLIIRDENNNYTHELMQIYSLD
ncbi:MAG: methyltransferase domain-containing protein [Synergistaceae bacterium]|nr:methyltransferase domain-containing protein [Synergistaceae bacterium]